MKYKSGGNRRRKSVAAAAAAARKRKKKNGNKFLPPKDNCKARDRMSELPDDILVSIISALPTLKEATATTVLSSRWRHLYTRITRLCLPPFEEPANDLFEDYIEAQSKKIPDFVNKIDHILDSCQRIRALKEFRLCYPDYEGWNIEFERCLEFAFTRAAEIIDMHIIRYNYEKELPFAFSVSTLTTKNGPNLPSFKSLKELHLCNLVVDDREVELVVSNFTLLEHLSIENCTKLKNVCVVGNSSSRLKHLDIFGCVEVVSIHVANMTNLVSLRWSQLFEFVWMLDNVPNLANFITSDYHMRFFPQVPLLSGLPSRVLDQLSHLQLQLEPKLAIPGYETGEVSYVFPKLKNVKRLELQVQWDDDGFDYSAYHLVSVIDACPILEKFEITFTRMGRTKFRNIEPIPCLFWTKLPFEQLKHVRISGFLGCPGEMQLVFHIIDKGVALEELIVEAFGAKARARAWRHLQPTTPSSVNLIII